LTKEMKTPRSGKRGAGAQREGDNGCYTTPDPWEASLEAFAKSKAFTCYAIPIEEVPLLFASAASGNAGNARLARVIVDWVAEARERKAGEGFLCVSCDHEFLGSGGGPAAFLVALPYAVASGYATVNAVCWKCAAEAGSTDGLLALAMKSYRGIWGDVRTVEEGRA
jgi:hypothetical protein